MRRIEFGVRRSRVAHKIRGHLLSQGLSLADVARELGVARQLVTATVRGEKHSPRVLAKLREHGVPEILLFDPSLVKGIYPTSKLAQLLGVSVQAISCRAKREAWKSLPRKGRGGGNNWLLASMPEETQGKVVAALLKAA